MPITFNVLSADLDPERSELRLTGTVDDGILVTGMIATGAGQSATVEEIELLDHEEHTQVFRLSFAFSDPSAADALRARWGEGTEVSLAY